MNSNKINSLLIPNISKTKDQKSVDLKKDLKSNSEFNDLLNVKIDEENKRVSENHGINLTNHAAKRVRERNLLVDNNEFLKIRDAIDKLKTKGGRESLVITERAAYIVDVDNNKIITAMDKYDMAENVFTNIDSTVFIN